MRGRRSERVAMSEIACTAMGNHVTVKLGNPTTADTLFESICALYDDVFSQPPFRWTDDESSHHRELLRNLRSKPSFGIATAERGEQLVGFAYGYTLPSDTKWWTEFTHPIPSGLGDEQEGRTFALIDLAVRSSSRGQGFGRRLVDTLLASRGEERATLSVQPAATETHSFYRNLGWTKVGTKKMPEGVVSPFFDIYVTPSIGQNRARRDVR